MTSCFFIGISLTSCEKDLYNLEENTQKQGVKIFEKSIDELNQVPGFSDAFRKVQTKTLELKNSTARTALEDLYDFTIVPDKIKVMERPDSTKSYTFFIERETKSYTYFENLVIQIDKTGALDAIIMKYIPTGSIVAVCHDSFVFEGEKEFTPLVTSGRIFYLLNGCVLTTWTTCTWLVTDDQHPEWASEHIAGGFCDDLTHLVNHSSLVCPEGGGEGPSDGDGTGQTGDGGGANGSVSTTPIHFTAGQLAYKRYIKNIPSPSTQGLGSCYATVSQDQEFNANLAAFFNTLDINDETITEESLAAVANQAIMAICNGGKVDFPNRIILDPTFLNNQKAMCVYNKMKNNNGFKTFTEPFNIDKPVAFVKLKAGAVEDNERAQTLPPDNNNIIEITINNDPIHPNGINAQPNLFLCQTIIHEIIHAEFFRRIIEALGSNPSGQTIQTIIDALMESNYQILANYLIESNVWPDWPHNYMAEQFRKAIARVTQEYATGNAVIGNPENIYMYYAWRGLDQFDVQAWINMLPETQTGIQNTIDNYIDLNSFETCH